MDESHADRRIERRRREDEALNKIEESHDDFNLRFSRALIALFAAVTVLTVCLGLAVWRGYSENRDRIHDLCEASNQQNASVRALARDLNASPEILGIVDHRFEDQHCK